MTEAEEQVCLVKYLRLKNIRHYAVPNGGKRDIAEASYMKLQGVSAGVPDLCLPYARKGYHGLYIEMKRRKGGLVSPAQLDWLQFLADEGCKAVVCYGFDEAIRVVDEYFSKVD